MRVPRGVSQVHFHSVCGCIVGGSSVNPIRAGGPISADNSLVVLFGIGAAFLFHGLRKRKYERAERQLTVDAARDGAPSRG
jgi:hypothetical protein